MEESVFFFFVWVFSAGFDASFFRLGGSAKVMAVVVVAVVCMRV